MRKGLLVAMILLSLGCSKVVSGGTAGERGLRSGSQIAEVFESAVTSIGAAPDEIEGEGFVTSSSIAPFAECAGRAGDEPCNQSTRRLRYNNCTVPDSPKRMDGEVWLEYNNASCALASAGQTAIRKIEILKQGLNVNLTVSSESKKNFKDENLSGGIKVSRAAGVNYTIEILGLHKTIDTGEDVSIRTTQPSTVETVMGLLERNGRVVKNGKVRVDQNSGEYTMDIVIDHWVYNASCCYPVSGDATLNFTGALSGTGTVKFTGCGQARLSALGIIANISLNSCE